MGMYKKRKLTLYACKKLVSIFIQETNFELKALQMNIAKSFFSLRSPRHKKCHL